MTTRLPLNALHVFCTIVREGGFRQAALALHVTPGAVSRQVQALEEHLAQLLFERGAGSHGVLTAGGRLLYEQVSDQMAGVLAVLDGRASARHTTVLVDTSVTLAMHWLIPQLRTFTEMRPDIHLQVRTGNGAINPNAPVDVFIRRDPSELRGLPGEMFMTERSVLVASPCLSPSISERVGNDMRWLNQMPRIGARSRSDLWPFWHEFHPVSSESLAPTLVFDNTVLAIQAAVQGLGACVVPEAFVAALLDSGSLELLHSQRVETGSYSFAIGRRRDSSKVSAFIDWLHEVSSVA
ncbi:MAG: LysR family transcriptional regulator [Ramlibacter sp.]|nr:LysR family transcriptional regulator [Ramlibacter sp.]